jgi:hypothetical protein
MSEIIKKEDGTIVKQEVSEQVLTVERFQMELQMLSQEMKNLETRQAGLIDIISKFQEASKG